MQSFTMREIIIRGEHTFNPYTKKKNPQQEVQTPHKALKNLKEAYAAALCYHAMSFGHLALLKAKNRV